MIKLGSYFDQIYVINLPYRKDRLQEVEAQLSKVGLSLSHERVTLFPAARPDNPGSFTSIGARGCYMSHLGVLKDAQQKAYSKILILEDDADISDSFLSLSQDQLDALLRGTWDMLYLGYRLEDPDEIGTQDILQVDASRGIGLSHAIGITQETIALITDYFEAILARPAGDPAGGPMHVDGAYCWFRKNNPSILTAASKNQLIIQRSSKTDIHETGWREHLPFVNLLRKAKNAFKNH